ncbi:ATP synthase subunit C [Thiocystis violacea]|uniref:ATP synthase subunit C n=1 Tax=Thiocystis violacea TaxID=13725 RepID=UPI001908BBBD|nr:ATP synthase subunit C [Thiocystis violacea]MBK1719619.1 H+transporting two-sector ATPase C subunit [Thiocystis violacea]
MNRQLLLVGLMVLGVALLAGISSLLIWSPAVLASETSDLARSALDPGVLRWGYFSAALVTGLGSLAAAYAVGRVGTAAVGALAEKPELFGRVIILVGLAEGIAIYGLIVSILILNRLN